MNDTDITCCECGSITRGTEAMKRKGGYYTVTSGFRLHAWEACDNCSHIFCDKCEYKEVTY